MRANEFIAEGPVASLGNWLDRQSAGALAKGNREDSLKVYGPKLVKAIHELLADQISKAEDKGTDLVELVLNVITRATSVDIAGNPHLFRKDLATLVTHAKRNPHVFKNSSEVAGVIKQIVSNSITLEKSKSAPIAGTDARQGQHDAEETPSGVDIGELKAAIKKELISDPKTYGGTKNRDAASNFIQHQLELPDNGLTDKDQIDQIADEIMQDPTMPFNAKLTPKFRAEVYAPDGIKNNSTVYAVRDDKWSQWRVGSHNTWQYLDIIHDPKQVAAVKQIIRTAKGRAIPMTFQQDAELPAYYNVSAKAPKTQ